MVGSTGTGNFCQADYIIIPMVTNVGRPPTGPFTTVDRICGGTLAADMTLNSTPVRSTYNNFLQQYTISCSKKIKIVNYFFILINNNYFAYLLQLHAKITLLFIATLNYNKSRPRYLIFNSFRYVEALPFVVSFG